MGRRTKNIREKAAYGVDGKIPPGMGWYYGNYTVPTVDWQQAKKEPVNEPVKKTNYTYTPSVQTIRQDNTYVKPVKVNSVLVDNLLGRRITNVSNPSDGGWNDKGWNGMKRRERLHQNFDPTMRLEDGSWIWAFGGNKARGEEDQYWRAYLGLKNDLPTMPIDAQTEWDYTVEKQKENTNILPSDFYGITPRMSANIEAMLDTLNLGKIVRNYDVYKQKEPSIPSKESLNFLYNQAVKILNNPEKWHKVNFDTAPIIKEDRNYVNEYGEENPLGMFRNAGVKYSNKDSAIYIHDTYDFPKKYHAFIPKRPREMKIRGKIDYNPLDGSFLLKNINDSLYNYKNNRPTHLDTKKYYKRYDEEDY